MGKFAPQRISKRDTFGLLLDQQPRKKPARSQQRIQIAVASPMDLQTHFFDPYEVRSGPGQGRKSPPRAGEFVHLAMPRCCLIVFVMYTATLSIAQSSRRAWLFTARWRSGIPPHRHTCRFRYRRARASPNTAGDLEAPVSPPVTNGSPRGAVCRTLAKCLQPKDSATDRSNRRPAGRNLTGVNLFIGELTAKAGPPAYWLGRAHSVPATPAPGCGNGRKHCLVAHCARR